MRCLLLTLAVFLCNQSLACTITRIIPDELQGKSTEEVDQYFLDQSFRFATIVLEATVTAVDHRGGFDLLHIRPENFWKTDGEPVEFVYQWPATLCHQNDLEVGARYIIFAKRQLGMLEYAKASSTPLSVSDKFYISSLADTASVPIDANTNEAASRMRSHLTKIAVIWVEPPVSK